MRVVRSGGGVDTYLYAPDGTRLAAFGWDYMDVIQLPATGTYTIVVDPYGSATGNITVTLYDVPADTSGAITIGGAAVDVSLSVPGQKGTLTFDGTANQQVTIRVTNNTFS